MMGQEDCMIYGVGLFGFLAGFVLGQMILMVLLRDRQKEELLENKALQRKYGTLNWTIALLSMASALYVYTRWVE